ncbi:Spo0B domain-containing protein [Aneurinibacillus terranovensis]|uniref:Spo0B domain-containing protein n=1 Tax=Aneurinibacillus terranovensis TaxID=278991 RepID=UPI000422CB85|nr:Spo0B domain-containing protein [Aneurinibacillus terranovensis]
MDKLTEVLKYQRHDLLNHMQVLLGYLKLKKYPMCEEYIYRLIDQMTRESIISGLDCPALVEHLLSFNAIHPDVELEVEIPEPFSLHQVTSRTDFLGEFILSFIKPYEQYSFCNNGEPNTLLLTLHYIRGSLRIVVDFNGRLDAGRAQIELDELRQRAEKEGAMFTVEIHTEEESVIECIFPF